MDQEIETLAEEQKSAMVPAAELVKWKQRARDAEAALEEMQAKSVMWRDRYMADNVRKPLADELDKAGVIPGDLLATELQQMGILRFDEDSTGVERPTWLDKDGKEQDISATGVHAFLVSLGRDDDYKHQDRLARIIRRSDARGGGATSSASGPFVTPKATPKPKPRPALGIQ